MINTIESYIDAGRRAGIASRRGDAGTADHEKRWLNRAIGFEQEADKVRARRAYEAAYAAEATPAELTFA